MTLAMLIQIAVGNLIAARRRTVLLFTALGLVTTLLVLLLSISQGITETLIKQATILSAGHVNVAGFFKSRVDQTAPIVTGAAELRDFVEKNVDGLDYVVDRHRGWAKVISPVASVQTGLSGVDIEEEPGLIERIQLAPMKDYKEGGGDEVVGDIAELGKPKTAVIFAAQAKRLEVQVGDELTITTETLSGMSNTDEVRIVAIAKDMGLLSNWNVFVPKQTILDLYRLQEDTTGAVMVYLKDPDRADAVRVQLEKTLADAGHQIMEHQPRPFFAKFEQVMGEDWTGQKLDLTTWQDEVSFLTQILTAFDTLSFFLIAILMVIIAMGIMNTMWISVRERTGEIGTLRAIGMSRSRVLMMFLLEALMLGFAATAAGALFGAIVSLTIDAVGLHVPWLAVQVVLMSDILHLVVTPNQIIGAVITFTLISGLSAIWPAFRASRMQPVTAIHHVG